MGITKAIQVSGLSFGYHANMVLEDVCIDIDAGKFTVILGRNGSGKSTFLRIIAGLQHYCRGNIWIEGKELQSIRDRERSKIIGYLGQQHKPVFPFLVKDVVLTGRAGYIRFVPGKKDVEYAEAAMRKTGILDLKNRIYTELSGGEQQMVMIARMLAQHPDILLFDEPTAHLDFCNQSIIVGMMKNIVKEGITVVAVFHDPNLAFLSGEDFLFVNDKKVIRPDTSTPAWDNAFLKDVYKGDIVTIPHAGKSIVIPRITEY